MLLMMRGLPDPYNASACPPSPPLPPPQLLKKLIMEHPSRATTQQDINRVKRQITEITTEGNKISQVMQVRLRVLPACLCP